MSATSLTTEVDFSPVRHSRSLQQRLAELADEQHRQVVPGQAPGVLKVPAKCYNRGDNCRLVKALTERNQRVLCLLAAGLSSTEVAEEPVISVASAGSYIKSLYAKLGSHSEKSDRDGYSGGAGLTVMVR